MARFIEFKFSDQHAICLNSRVRELRVVLYKPSLKRKKRELREIRGGLVEPKVRPSFSGFHLS